MRTVLAHGVFDLLHSGHVAHLMQCKSFGDRLIVSVLADEHVKKSHKLLFDVHERAYMVGALKCVDSVILCKEPGPWELLTTLRPAVYARNDEYLDQSKREYITCRELGISVAFTRTYPPHTSDLISMIKALP